MNRTLIRRHCTLCHEPFHRSHVNRCPALRDAPRLQTLWDRFDHELHQRQRNGLFDNFCLLDMLLNIQDYEEFEAAVSLIEGNSEWWTTSRHNPHSIILCRTRITWLSIISPPFWLNCFLLFKVDFSLAKFLIVLLLYVTSIFSHRFSRLSR